MAWARVAAALAGEFEVRGARSARPGRLGRAARPVRARAARRGRRRAPAPATARPGAPCWSATRWAPSSTADGRRGRGPRPGGRRWCSSTAAWRCAVPPGADIDAHAAGLARPGRSTGFGHDLPRPGRRPRLLGRAPGGRPVGRRPGGGRLPGARPGRRWTAGCAAPACPRRCAPTAPTSWPTSGCSRRPTTCPSRPPCCGPPAACSTRCPASTTRSGWPRLGLELPRITAREVPDTNHYSIIWAPQGVEAIADEVRRPPRREREAPGRDGRRAGRPPRGDAGGLLLPRPRVALPPGQRRGRAAGRRRPGRGPGRAAPSGRRCPDLVGSVVRERLPERGGHRPPVAFETAGRRRVRRLVRGARLARRRRAWRCRRSTSPSGTGPRRPPSGPPTRLTPAGAR